jgi:hypothetical protein
VVVLYHKSPSRGDVGAVAEIVGAPDTTGAFDTSPEDVLSGIADAKTPPEPNALATKLDLLLAIFLSLFFIYIMYT